MVHRFDLDAELERAESSAGPFAGVPFLMKDEVEIAGLPMTYGSNLLRGYVSTHTHPIAARFRDAGFVMLGRTNMSELGLLPVTEPVAHGPTHNPWKLGHSPGGSSGGSGAAVAAGIVPIAHGGDGGGSVRIPAAACGLVGLKPSRGRHPMGVDDAPQGFVVHHGLTRTVRDSAALLDHVSGAHAQRFSLAAPRGSFREAAARDPAPLRIGFTPRGFLGEALAPSVNAEITRLAQRLEGLGHRVEEVAVPIDTRAYAEAFRALWATAAGVFLKLAQRAAPLPAWVKRFVSPRQFRALTAIPSDLARGQSGPPLRPRVEFFTRWLAAREAEHSPSDLWIAQLELEAAAQRLREFFGSHDLWLTSTLSTPPPRIGALAVDGLDEDAMQRALFGLVGFTPIANGTGFPAISVPAGISEEGLPVGAHFLAPMGREDRLLALAGQVERAHPWTRLAPLASFRPAIRRLAD